MKGKKFTRINFSKLIFSKLALKINLPFYIEFLKSFFNFYLYFFDNFVKFPTFKHILRKKYIFYAVVRKLIKT